MEGLDYMGDRIAVGWWGGQWGIADVSYSPKPLPPPTPVHGWRNVGETGWSEPPVRIHLAGARTTKLMTSRSSCYRDKGWLVGAGALVKMQPLQRCPLKQKARGRNTGFSSAPHPPLGLIILEARALGMWQIQFSLKQSRGRRGWGINLKADTNN